MGILFFRRRIKELLQQSISDRNDPASQVIVSMRKDSNTNEGSEFLDDAIRMKEQPFMYTEESVAPGSPEGLW